MSHQSPALQRLKEARTARQLSSFSAAASDGDNDAYMQRFNEAFSAQQLTASPPTAQPATTQSGGLLQQQRQSTGHHHHHQHPHPVNKQQPTNKGNLTALHRPAVASSKIGAARQQRPDAAAASTPAIGLAAGWRTGPVDGAGVLVQVSERPLLCSCSCTPSAADGTGNVVVGSSDHALYVVDTAAGRKKRTLYSKTTGHTEWVTTVCCLPGGAILSGGMDGRLWLWPATGAAGTEVKSAHDAPVSKVAALQQQPQPQQQQQQAAAASSTGAATHSSRGGSGSSRRPAVSSRGLSAGGPAALAASCSYDKTVKLWQVSGRTVKGVAVMSGHPGPVLELAVAPGGQLLLTGDRKGSLMAWDVSTASSGWGVKDAHAGHITALAWQQQVQQQEQPPASSGSSANLLALSGGQDGCLRVWDTRSGSCVAKQQLHVGAQGKGAVGGIVTVAAGGQSQLVVTAGADKTLRVCDPAASYRALHTVALTDFPYALAAAGDGLVVCGCGDGSVHVVDVLQGKTLYALGAGRAAVRCLEVCAGSKLVCAGDDGCVVSYQFA